MSQLHKRFSDEQGLMTREEVQDTLGIKRSRFFHLWKQCREDPQSFSISYHRTTPKRISSKTEEAIKQERMREKGLIEDHV